MDTEIGNKEEQWKNSVSSFSSSRSSSITSDSSDGHFDIRHFPLPKPSLSAQKLRESHQAYDPNRIPSSVFSSKPGNSADWSIASNESLFSIHDGSFNISTREDHGFAAPLRLAEIPRLEEPAHEIDPVPIPLALPPVKKPDESVKEIIAEEEQYQVETSDSEVDDSEIEERRGEVESDDEHEEEEEEMIEAEVLVETETKILEKKEVVQVAKENQPEDSNSIVSHSPSISCRSDTSTNSIGSFAFPLLQKEDVLIKTPSMEIRGYQLTQSPVLPPQPQPQPQPYSESGTLTELQPESQQQQPQRKASKKMESRTQSLKASRIGWFSCFHCPSKCGLFK
ncbi:hypothetical protein CARUB_v10015736mg [Capsella rubella]|uniref:Uncharacterized protein n=1 Tax=Capsella rubella TaxID=81985 RepID=R0HRP9_9BRAS|nr:uncharacterized protein LOC17892965 [Capsella rubella]EOA32459.1 hypothetical protein CARUB_v10015736mg [Capsella rubella]